MLLISKEKSHVDHMKKMLVVEFNMKYLGAARKILGMKIKRYRGRGQLFLNQQGYLEKLVDQFTVRDSKDNKLPLGPQIQLSKDQCLGKKKR